MIETSPSPSTPRDPHLPEELAARLPEGWSYGVPDESDALELTALMRRHQEQARGWASAGPDDILIEVSARGYLTRENVVLRDAGGAIRGWASAHDRAAGRMLFAVTVDAELDDATADVAAEVLFGWGDGAARRVGASRELEVQQIDSGAFADDEETGLGLVSVQQIEQGRRIGGRTVVDGQPDHALVRGQAGEHGTEQTRLRPQGGPEHRCLSAQQQRQAPAPAPLPPDRERAQLGGAEDPGPGLRKTRRAMQLQARRRLGSLGHADTFSSRGRRAAAGS